MTTENFTKNGLSVRRLESISSSRWLVPAFILLAVALAMLSNWDGLKNLYMRWAYEDEYGYGFLAAALVPVFIWRLWGLIQERSGGARWPGLALVLVAQVFGVLGALGESYFVEQVAFVLTLLGLAVVAFGIGPIRIFVPLAVILLLTIPIPYTLQAIITLKLQLLSTNLGVAAIRFLGIPVYVEGNIIDLGSYKLQVAEACSGLRYLLPLTCISFILAYLYEAPFWKRAIIVASAPLLTVFINSVRIAIVAVLVERFGSHMAEGFLHEFEGWLIFLFGSLLLGALILVLEGFKLSKVRITPIFGGPPIHRPARFTSRLDGTTVAALVVCAAAFAVTGSISWAQAHTPIVVREPFASFPRQVGGWSGREGQLEPDILSILKPTDYYIGDFSESSNKSPRLTCSLPTMTL